MQLGQQVKDLVDHPAQDGRGRPPRLPKNFEDAVAQQKESAEQWDRRFSRVWNKKDSSLPTQAAKLQGEEVTEERLRQARELAFQLRQVANEALAQAEKAEQVVRDFERILSQRQSAEMVDQPGPILAKTG